MDFHKNNVAIMGVKNQIANTPNRSVLKNWILIKIIFQTEFLI